MLAEKMNEILSINFKGIYRQSIEIVTIRKFNILKPKVVAYETV